jgi:hypothetical protein
MMDLCHKKWPEDFRWKLRSLFGKDDIDIWIKENYNGEAVLGPQFL